jgi:hypothetical protein
VTSAAPNRRAFLRFGAVTVLAPQALLATACTPEANDAAHAPWTLWDAPSARGTPLALVAAGILAANPHDTQPWLFHVEDGAIHVFADVSRNLGAMDPFVREMHIGLGCAIENMTLAATANGFAAEVELVPGSLLALTDRKGYVRAATLHLSRRTTPIATPASYSAIPLRHTNRYPYDRSQPLPTAWRAGLENLVDDPRVRLFLFEAGARRAAYDSAVVDATQAIISDAPMIADSDRWFRSDAAQIEKYRSGPTLETAGLSPPTYLMAKTLPLPARFKHDAWVSQTRDSQVATAPLTGFIAVRDRYDRPTALAVGRIWQRLHLAATLAGVAVQPMNQPMEMVDRDRQLGRRHRRAGLAAYVFLPRRDVAACGPRQRQTRPRRHPAGLIGCSSSHKDAPSGPI